ncbi:hypothetical protein ZEAMMB73_Zm00001d010510 [Zea mays]|uniref:Uncharacterized protein n=1 Tax=Zea mays TaxID=4577 RepID=A0A1D6FRJ0_MAIZE|nr:hypothetical protein ZEAMMB73_Zm00001d010510 [Zea mays]
MPGTEGWCYGWCDPWARTTRRSYVSGVYGSITASGVLAVVLRWSGRLYPGLVRYPVSATLPQIGSRLFLTWGVFWSFPEVID